MSSRATALLAEDEPLLARALKKRLLEQWPELVVIAEASDGLSATLMALEDTPDVLFLDIQLPGRNGLEIAQAVIDDWPGPKPPPLIVFVTAYEEFAIDAFECEAVDFLQKPVTRERLAKTVARLKARLAERASPPAADGLASLIKSISGLAPAAASAKLLDTLHIGVGNTIRIIPIADVLYFEAADKYVNVVTVEGEGLIRISMRELMAQIDLDLFMQVHRAVVVNRKAIKAALRDDTGRISLQLRDSPKTVAVSRAFAHLFKPM